MSRKPIYSGARWRIVSRPNGLWRVERKTSDEKGENATKTRPHWDPWQPWSRDTTREAAETLLRTINTEPGEVTVQVSEAA